MSRVKVLIVDDNATGRELLRDTIELEGEYDIVTAASGAEALRLAVSEQPDIVLMDLHMPLMDGYTTTQNLKRNPVTAHIPVVAMTASHVMSEDQQKAMQVGCSDYLQKPVPRLLLLQKIREHVQR